MIRTTLALAVGLVAAVASQQGRTFDGTQPRGWLSKLDKETRHEPWEALQPPVAGAKWMENLGTSTRDDGDRRVLPPEEHDHPYTGKLTLIRVKTEKEITALCPATTFRYKLGCAFAATGSCRVIIVGDDVIAKAGYTYDTIYRHELAHCNGWPGTHWGARLAPDPKDARRVPVPPTEAQREAWGKLPKSVQRGLGLIP